MVLDPKNRDGYSKGDEKFLRIIDEYGWHVLTVAPRVNETGITFAYSTGLFYHYGHPEIIVLGQGTDLMHSMINEVGDRVKSGERFLEGVEYGSLIANFNCTMRQLHKSWYREYPAWSRWFYEGEDFPCLQCFWPDKKGRFPWYPRCDDWARELQPLLYEPRRDYGQPVP